MHGCGGGWVGAVWCVCVCLRARLCVWVCLRARVSVCLCVCALAQGSERVCVKVAEERSSSSSRNGKLTQRITTEMRSFSLCVCC